MSAQLRFRTLVKHAGSIYDAAKEARTGLLMSSLDDIVEKINPQGAADWHKVRHDTQRVLKVWLSREQTHAAQMLADQLMDSLAEFSEEPVAAAAAAAVVAAPLPHLEIVEKPAVAPAPAPTVLLTAQIETDSIADEEDDDNDDDDVLVASDEDEDDDEAAEADDNEDDEEDDEEVGAAPAAAAAPEGDNNDDAEDDEEVLEPDADAPVAAEDDEEEGMEVEKRTIRGRDYWIDVNTQKLYAVIDDDDVGDEVGAIVNGRPVFLSA